MFSTNQWIAVGTGAALGAAFIGYCIYFDQKRRSDPDFRKKLKERKLRILFEFKPIYYKIHFRVSFFGV